VPETRSQIPVNASTKPSQQTFTTTSNFRPL
jgi:hypothetical protein